MSFLYLYALQIKVKLTCSCSWEDSSKKASSSWNELFVGVGKSFGFSWLTTKTLSGLNTDFNFPLAGVVELLADGVDRVKGFGVVA